ncbi:hypothetical protein [Streptomyces yaizuensis]|uniref:DUF4276 family protein n=1 Tax=Streptomyces yaizuensis TaxID=2989713 RepID=A0ABQ5NRA2_9ACTN|nr:hypothetical protein [Streptomyces sp. YSPA8]GLF92899.1 DUF4276 family protein [Streptomyces sp. YSPA8]
MPTPFANEDTRLSLWLRVRRFAVPPSMIETATARRRAGDWAGACAAAGIDTDLDLRSVARAHGRELASRIRADLRHLAPDLLRWHMPRVAPDGLLRPGLTIPLARYDTTTGQTGSGPGRGTRSVHLVARTPPAWADAGQRIVLTLWDGSRHGSRSDAGTRRYPHPHPSRRFRLDLHRHLWDARSAPELRFRSGADGPPPDGRTVPYPEVPNGPHGVPDGNRCAVDRWAAEAGILLQAEGRSTGTVAVRFGARQRLLLHLDGDSESAGAGPPTLRITPADRGGTSTVPVLPDAATWVLPDLELIRAGLIGADALHPLVAAALMPGHSPAGPGPAGRTGRAGQPRIVECRGARHRIGLVDGVLAALDHDPDEIRREELLAALTGTPLPCLRAIDEAHRRPSCLPDVRGRLDHGDTAGALAVVEGLLGPGALLRDGDLREELEAAARRRIAYGLFRAGLTGPGPGGVHPDRDGPDDGRPRPGRTRTGRERTGGPTPGRDRRSHPRHASSR